MPEETNNPFAVTDFYERSLGSGPRISISKILHSICMTAADFPNPPPILDPTCASKKRCCFSIWRGVLNRCFTAVRRFTSFTATCSGLPVAVSAGRYCRSQGDRSHSGANSSRTSMAVLLAVPFGRTGRSSSPMSNCSALSSSPITRAVYTASARSGQLCNEPERHSQAWKCRVAGHLNDSYLCRRERKSHRPIRNIRYRSKRSLPRWA